MLNLQTLRRIAAWKPLWIAAGLAALYTATGFLLVPYAIEREVPRFLEQNLGTNASLGKVRFNPFLFKLEANDFRLGDVSKPVVAFRRLFVDVDAIGVLRRAWTVADIHLDALQVNAEISRDGKFTLAELAEQWAKHRPKKPEEPPPRVIVDRVKLTAASASFIDLSAPQRPMARVQAVDVDVTDLATVSGTDGRYVLSAKVADGGTLSWRGNLSLQPIASKGEWQIQRVKLATPWRFVRDELRIAEPRGLVDFAGHYTFSYAQGASTLALSHLHASIAGLALALEGEREPLAALDKIELTDASYDVAKHELVVPRVAFANGMLTAALSPAGELDWQRIAKQHTKTGGEPAHAAPSPRFHARAEAVSLENVGLRFADHTRSTPLECAATVNAALKVDFESEKTNRLMLDAARVGLSDASLRAVGAGEPLLKLKTFEVGRARIDMNAHSVLIESIGLRNGDVQVSRAQDGHLALADAFSAAPVNPAVREKGQPAAPAWRYEVRTADVDNVRVAYVDRSFKPALRYDLDVAGTFKAIASDTRSPIGMTAAIRVAQGGTLNAKGTLAQDFTRADLRLDARGFRAEPLQPVVARYTALSLKSGSAAASAHVLYSSGAKPALRVQGKATIQDLVVNESDTGDRFVSWKTLNAEDIALTLTPNALLVKEVRIDEPGAKLVIAKDRSMNLTHVLKRENGATASASKKDETSERFPVRVSRIALRRGTVDYADQSLVLPFATRVTSLDGAIVGLSSSPRSRAELKLEGEISPNGQARAEGSLRPADPKSFLDIDVRFDNVEMPPLSPYTATFAGRKIAAGRLWVDVHYKIVDSQLLGDNKITLADFALGERVKAPNALDLPLDLAVALLKEPDGRINLAVPVRGDLNNPKFDYGALIRDAIGNTLKRIVTAPFRFLANLFGGSAEELQNVEFDAGSAELLPPEREQLQKITKALKEKQQLKLVVHGAYSQERDGRALRNRAVRLALAQMLDVKLAPGEDPGPIALDDAGTQRALEKLMTQRAGDNAVDVFAADYAKRTGQEPRRVNPVLALIHRGRGSRPFYEALFEKLVQIEPLPQAALADLAASRAHIIADFVARSGIEASRIEIGDVETLRDGTQAVTAKLTLRVT